MLSSVSLFPRQMVGLIQRAETIAEVLMKWVFRGRVADRERCTHLVRLVVVQCSIKSRKVVFSQVHIGLGIGAPAQIVEMLCLGYLVIMLCLGYQQVGIFWTKECHTWRPESRIKVPPLA